MHKEYASAKELVGLPYVNGQKWPDTERGVHKKADALNIPKRKRAGTKAWEYLLTALPVETQAALFATRAPSLPLPAPTALIVPKPAEPALDLAAQKAAGDAAAAHLKGNAAARMDAKRELLALITRAKQFDDLNIMTAVAEYNAGRLEVRPETRALIPTTSVPSVHRWFQQVNGYGLARLAGRYGHRLGTGVIDQHPPLAAALRAFILEHPHAQAKRAHEWLAARYDLDWAALPAELAGDGPIPMPSPKTVDRWIARWKADHAPLYERLRNPDAWKNRYMIGWGDMSAQLTHPNQIWEFDSTPADVLLDDGRHSILAVIDLYTRRVQLHISQTSKAAAVAHLTKKALLAWGVPEIAKTDNGQDYVSKHINRLFYALGIEHQVSAPFSPWQKPFIERFFRTFSHDLIELLPGYIGHNVADRQALRAKHQFADRLFVKDHTVQFTGLTAAALQDFCDRWRATYETRPHDGLGGQTPRAVSDAYPEPAQRIQDERVLNLLLQEVPGDGWRTVTKTYGIRIDHHEYLSKELVPWVGQRVRVLYDPEDAGLIYCLDDKDQFIGRAECPELTGTSRAQLAKECALRQRQDTNAQTAAVRRESKAFFPKDAADTILNARERLVIWPPVEEPRAETYTTPAIEGATQALLPPPEPEIIEVSAERQAALRQEIAAREAALVPSPLVGAGETRPDFNSPWARVRWTFALVLNDGRPRETISAEDRAYVRDWFSRKPSLETSIPAQFAEAKREQYQDLRAWFLREPAAEEIPDLNQRAVG